MTEPMSTRRWNEEDQEFVIDCPRCEGNGHEPDDDGVLCVECGGAGHVSDEDNDE